MVKHTSNTVKHGRVGNTKTLPKATRSRNYAGTWNNYTNTDYEHIVNLCITKKWKYVVGKEIGESGTPHLQWYIESKNAIKWQVMKDLLPNCHIEKARKGSQKNLAYCMKDGDFVTNIEFKGNARSMAIDEVLNEEYGCIVWKKWQMEVINICLLREKNRKINWYWEQTGNVGKSYLVKYLAAKHKVVIANGKGADIMNQVGAAMDAGQIPRIVVLDIPRCVEHISWNAIEQLKNGCFYSGKYEGSQCIFPAPQVVVFANEPPDTSKMSMDRWNIVEING